MLPGIKLMSEYLQIVEEEWPKAERRLVHTPLWDLGMWIPVLARIYVEVQVHLFESLIKSLTDTTEPNKSDTHWLVSLKDF